MKTPWHLRLFRSARAASPVWNVTKTLAQTVAFWAVFLLLLPRLIVHGEQQLSVPAFSLGTPAFYPWLLFAVFGLLGLASGFTMAICGRGTPLPLDGPRQLVVAGPYRYVRNPMAIAGLAQGACVALHFGSWLTIAYVLAGGLLWNFVVRPIEERHLERDFGEEFMQYQAAVRCWLPRLRPFEPAEDKGN